MEWGEFEALTQAELFRKDIPFLIENYPAFFCRYHRGLQTMASLGGKKWRDVKVIVKWGVSGSGKTRSVMELDDVYKLDPPYKWWDGYYGEKNLLLDDYKKDAMDRGMLLNICDGYKLRLETKGGHCWANWDTVYITSNYDPEMWACSALERRITDIVECQVGSI